VSPKDYKMQPIDDRKTKPSLKSYLVRIGNSFLSRLFFGRVCVVVLFIAVAEMTACDTSDSREWTDPNASGGSGTTDVSIPESGTLAVTDSSVYHPTVDASRANTVTDSATNVTTPDADSTAPTLLSDSGMYDGSADGNIAVDSGETDGETAVDSRETDSETVLDADQTDADAPVQEALVGWASVSGDGVATTTGGLGGQTVTPSSAQELIDYAQSDSALIIRIQGVFNVPRLQVNSNKTLIGIGANATVDGGLRIRGREDEMVHNVIVKNLRINGASSQVDDDAVQVHYAHHVWIDHCEIWDGRDGNLDIVHASNWITISWNKIHYTSNYQRPSGESSDHRFACLIGHSDNNADEDTNRLKVTFHHNYWAEGVIERMPRVRFGQVHIFNNYFASPGNNYCIRAGAYAQLLIEGNYFDGVNYPHEFNNSDDEKTAHITARDNEYQNVNGKRAVDGGGTPFTSPPYQVSIDPARSVPDIVTAFAGPC
jgi:pectate lyase